jgi:type I restriction enzyme M protein
VNKKDGTSEVKTRREKLKQLDDDLPKITEAYFNFL